MLEKSLVVCPYTNTANFTRCIVVAYVDNLYIDFTYRWLQLRRQKFKMRSR